MVEWQNSQLAFVTQRRHAGPHVKAAGLITDLLNLFFFCCLHDQGIRTNRQLGLNRMCVPRTRLLLSWKGRMMASHVYHQWCCFIVAWVTVQERKNSRTVQLRTRRRLCLRYMIIHSPKVHSKTSQSTITRSAHAHARLASLTAMKTPRTTLALSAAVTVNNT